MFQSFSKWKQITHKKVHHHSPFLLLQKAASTWFKLVVSDNTFRHGDFESEADTIGRWHELLWTILEPWRIILGKSIEYFPFRYPVRPLFWAIWLCLIEIEVCIYLSLDFGDCSPLDRSTTRWSCNFWSQLYSYKCCCRKMHCRIGTTDWSWQKLGSFFLLRKLALIDHRGRIRMHDVERKTSNGARSLQANTESAHYFYFPQSKLINNISTKQDGKATRLNEKIPALRYCWMHLWPWKLNLLF